MSNRLPKNEWNEKVEHYSQMIREHLPIGVGSVDAACRSAKDIVRDLHGEPLPDAPPPNRYSGLATTIIDEPNSQPKVEIRASIGGNYTKRILHEVDIENFIFDLQEHLKYVRAVKR